MHRKSVTLKYRWVVATCMFLTCDQALLLPFLFGRRGQKFFFPAFPVRRCSLFTRKRKPDRRLLCSGSGSYFSRWEGRPYSLNDAIFPVTSLTPASVQSNWQPRLFSRIYVQSLRSARLTAARRAWTVALRPLIETQPLIQFDVGPPALPSILVSLPAGRSSSW